MVDAGNKSVFGPVPSRRLGRSLGIDLVPYKTCTFDCTYCQLGRTTNKTLERRECTPLTEILDELDGKLAEDRRPDYITLAGSGEPTLYSKLGLLVYSIKQMTDIPIAALTNGSLLWDPEVREDLRGIDLLVPSLDAGDARAFLRVNRPHPEITFERMMEGLVAFRSEYPGQIWLEVFLLGGMTGCDAEVQKISAQVERIRPDRVQLNTVIRPPAEASALAVPKERLLRLAKKFREGTEIIADFDHVHDQEDFEVSREAVLNLLRRRPCSLEDMVQGLEVHPNELLKYLDNLRDDGAITTVVRMGTVYFCVQAERSGPYQSPASERQQHGPADGSTP